ncbi:hypothetical protein K469DRAFT_710849 [Zopfia rhizophila CBS 207.26]|uniref:Galactose oxidase n=1 Tax=Zopfia rhizophila CBS 207.26 TaxID=1314779 RepID=A0A6A6DX23_9PEZI|nr:hypothetical protein K469DRAFT_710849 [Zopfia rhizophila CBS 207.26]
MAYMKSSAVLHVPLVWLYLWLPITMAQIPYNPTRILQNDTLLYVFRPSPDSSSQFELGSMDLSSKVAASELPFTTLYPTLPFLDTKTGRAFTPLLDHGGNMTVYTGDCSKGASGAEVWTFTPKASEGNGNGSWKQEKVTYDQNGKHAPAIGSNYLNGGMSFSSIVDGDALDTGAFLFGGMCPFQDEGEEYWQSAANYSNLMVTLEPSQDGEKAINYQIGVSSSRGPPIAEAGFTLTGLQSSFSNKSDGTQTQQQNFVLVGGHTSSAFINMSQVALFSLPQQSWSFLPVRQPDPQRTDIAVRTDVDEIEPRSGHTAVLTPDGQHIVLFGGWIGDIDTPADPQFAVLNLGEGYGGQGAWEWTVPTTSGSGLARGSGVYGHGAVMLPGGVMMVMGGYSISATSSRWRRAGPTASTQTFFLNITSNTWISDYSPPPNAGDTSPKQTGPLTKSSQKAGLGVGLGIGMASVLGLMVFYIWYTRRLKKQREAREKQLRDLAMGAHRFNIECLTPGVDGRGGQIDAVDYFDEPHDSYFYPSAGHQQNQGWRQANGHDAERTGLLVEIPSPTRGLRRSLNGRASHHLTARYDEKRVRGYGNIHPIDELEEEEQEQANDKTPLSSKPEMAERSSHNRGISIYDNAPTLDPSTDNNRLSGLSTDQRHSLIHSAPTSPTREEAEETNRWSNDWQASMGGLSPGRSSPNSTGRVSPAKSERTGSNLSESSTRSNLSSNNSTNGSLNRSMSVRSAALLNSMSQNHSNPFKTPDASPTTDKANRNSGGWQSPVDPRTRSLTSIRSNGRPNTANADADSFMTARTSFMQLQAEGEALLGGNPDRARPGTSSTSNGSNTHTYRDTDASISRAGTVTTATSVTDGLTRPRERRRSWLGSVRRALTRSTTTATDSRTRSLTTGTRTPTFDAYTDAPDSPTRPTEPPTQQSANRKSFPSSAPPRRAASDASFWRSKRGKQDWLDDEIDPNDPKARWRRNSGDNWGAPEDVALAEKERQRREWRQRGNLIGVADGDHLPLPSPIAPHDPEGEDDRPSTPADEEDWDVEAAVERRVVQVMFTVPKTRLRVVNADVDGSSILSVEKETPKKDKDESRGSPGSSGRVRDLVGRFEREGTPKASPRPSPRPSPAPSVKSIKGRKSSASLRTKMKRKERATDARAEER